MKHDTGIFGPVDTEGVRTCAVHRETCNDLYGAINSRVSTSVFRWTAGVLGAVAVAFGIALWSWTSGRCDRTDAEVSEMVRKTIKIEADLEHIKAAQTEMKEEQKRTRTEMLDEFRRLRELVQRGG